MSEARGALAIALTTIDSELERSYPEALPAAAGADDAEIARLAAALAPYQLTSEVEELLRWRNGGADPMFHGWYLRSVDDIIQQRSFRLDDIGDPPALLEFMTGEGLSMFVTLGDGRAEPPSDVWTLHSHDDMMHRTVASISALFTSLAEAMVESSAEWEPWAGIWLTSNADSLPPGGIVESLSRFPEPGWPPAWLASLGTHPDAARARGATHTIAALIELSRSQTAHGTVVGSQRLKSGTGDVSYFQVDDGTGSLAVTALRGDNPFWGTVGMSPIEIDVVVEQGAVGRSGAPDPDPVVERLLGSAAVPARGYRVRPAAHPVSD